jgi:hypothetical protein
MPYDVSYKILAGVTFVAVPCLTILAYRGWTKRLRHELPRWRSALGLASLVVTLLSWFCLAILALSALMDLNAGSSTPDWVGPIALVLIVGTSLAFALKGASRIEAIVAGLLMVAAWMTSVVS